jgi:tripartite-type tricarboxylate transporter receptor subunit TctC
MGPDYSQLQAGKIRALAVAGPKRLPQLPEVPTTSEAGVSRYELGAWFCVVAPKGTPAVVVSRLNREVQHALAQKDVADTFTSWALSRRAVRRSSWRRASGTPP